MVAPLAPVALIALIALASSSCHFFVGVTPCLDDKNACAKGQVCDEKLGICGPPAPPPPPPPATGSCGAPLPLTLGEPVNGDTTGITSALESGDCDGGHAGELVYTVTLDHDAHLHAEVFPALTSNADVQVYARHDDCTNPADDFACGDQYPGGVPEQIANFDVKANQPVFVVVDGFNLNDTGPFTLTVIEVDDVDGSCDATSTTTRCPKGQQCVDGKCAGGIPGDVCTSAIRLDGATGSIDGDTSQLNDDIEASVLCVGPSFTTVGADLFYVVNLAQGATLDAKLTPAPNIDQGLYLQSACPPPIDGSCVDFADGGSYGAKEELTFKNNGAAADFYVIVDGFTETMNGPFTLDWTITSP